MTRMIYSMIIQWWYRMKSERKKNFLLIPIICLPVNNNILVFILIYFFRIDASTKNNNNNKEPHNGVAPRIWTHTTVICDLNTICELVCIAQSWPLSSYRYVANEWNFVIFYSEFHTCLMLNNNINNFH